MESNKPIKLSLTNGEVLLMSRLQLHDFPDIMDYCEKALIAKAKKQMERWGDLLTQEKKEQIMAETDSQLEAMTTPLGTTAQTMLTTFHGFIWLLTYLIQKVNPELTSEQIQGKMELLDIEKVKAELSEALLGKDGANKDAKTAVASLLAGATST